jgi:hypothetical protein
MEKVYCNDCKYLRFCVNGRNVRYRNNLNSHVLDYSYVCTVGKEKIKVLEVS